MDLNDILNKTKKKSEQIKVIRNPPSIASTDRPYSEEDLPKETRKTISTLNNTPFKTDNKVTTNWQQSDNKVTTNWQQTDNKKNETDNKVATELTTELTTNWQQSDNKVTTNWQQTDNKVTTKTTFSMLVGLQRSCLIFIYKSCKANRHKNTEPLSLKHIAQSLKNKEKTIKITLQRLEDKKCLIRVNFKNGRGGWSIYELPESIFTEMLRFETDNKLTTNWQQSDNKVTTNWQQTDNKVATELTTELTTSLPSSSSYYINKTTTSEALLAGEWETIDIEPVQDIGFTTTHLVQIVQQGKLSPAIVQDSIHAFAFDLKYNNKETTLKGSPLNYFMGIVRNGNPYAPPENYESPSDRGMRIYLERKQKIEQMRAAKEEKLITLEFTAWEKGQSEENKLALLPEDIRMSRLSGHKQASLRAYFLKEIWPQRKKSIEKEILNIMQEDINSVN